MVVVRRKGGMADDILNDPNPYEWNESVSLPPEAIQVWKEVMECVKWWQTRYALTFFELINGSWCLHTQ